MSIESTVTPSSGNARDPSRLLAFACALAFVLVVSVVFRDAVVQIYASWQQEEYSHGYIIPFIAAALLVKEIMRAPFSTESSWTGFGIVLLCFVLFILFEISGVKGLLPQTYLASLVGLLVLFWGRRAAVKLAAPMAFLLFSVPLPALIYYNLSFNMRLLSTELGVQALRMLDISVYLDGNIIDLGSYQLQVADACNGVRYLFPLLSLSFLIAYLYKAALWKRVLLFVSALPITVALNGLRIALIGVTVNRWGPAMATGTLHDFEGWVFFMACTALLALEVVILQRIGSKGVLDFDFSALRPAAVRQIPRPRLGGPTLASGVVLAAGLAAAIFAPRFTTDYVRSVPLRQSFAQFPTKLGPWTGRFDTLDPVSLAVLGTDDYLLAEYTKPDASSVTLYALYYQRQDSTSNSAVHTPAVCLPAGGWTILSNAVKTVAVNNATLEVNRVLIQKGTTREIVYYWYVQSGVAMRVPTNSRMYLIKHAISTGTTNGAMIRISSLILPGETEAATEERMTDFLRVGMGTIDSYMF